jgi:putative transposase
MIWGKNWIGTKSGTSQTGFAVCCVLHTRSLVVHVSRAAEEARSSPERLLRARLSERLDMARSRPALRSAACFTPGVWWFRVSRAAGEARSSPKRLLRARFPERLRLQSLAFDPLGLLTSRMRHNDWGYVYRTRRRDEECPVRYLTFECNHGESLFSTPLIKDRFVQSLRQVSKKLPVELIAWVIMPNHVHLLIRRNNVTAKTYLRSIKAGFARSMLAIWRRSDDPVLKRLTTCKGVAFWRPGGGHDDPVYCIDHLTNLVHYTHLNPVRWKLAQRAVDWPWSSAREYAAKELEQQRIVEFGGRVIDLAKDDDGRGTTGYGT